MMYAGVSNFIKPKEEMERAETIAPVQLRSLSGRLKPIGETSDAY